MKILIFGASGFIGSSLVSYFSPEHEVNVAKIHDNDSVLQERISHADVIINAAGVSRSESENDFFMYNIYHAQRLFSILNTFVGKMYIYFSSTHFNAPSLYGFSKRYNEFLLRDLNFDNKNQFLCLRIPSVFGPGMKPNYVSVVATFCNNVAKNQESKIIDGGKTIPLLHADDLLSFIDAKISNKIGKGYELVESFPDTIEITVAELFESINTIAHQNKKHNNGSRFLNRLTHIYNFYS